MATRKPASGVSVDEFLASLAHPCVEEIQELRKLLLGADARISEGIKWNSPSFRTTEWFATVNLRAKSGVRLILHLGAKPRPGQAPAIDDPEGLLEWLSPDRAMVALEGVAAVRRHGKALQAIVRSWIEFV